MLILPASRAHDRPRPRDGHGPGPHEAHRHIGVAVHGWLKKRPFLQLADFLAPAVPFGLMAGRFGNFINGELWGRATTVPWGMAFPQAGDGMARHPSQLYEMGLEGFALFALVWWFARKPRPTGQISALFLMGYGVFRFLVEFTREPDNYLGLLAGGLSMGQLLSLPMILAGALIFVFSARRSRRESTQ